MKKVCKEIPLDETSSNEVEKVQEGYTLIYASGDGEIDYIYVNTLKQAELEALDIIDDGETDIDEIDNFEHIICVLKGRVEPLGIKFTRSLKIVEE
ncbi:MAG: hypothetical protein WC516_04495 [Patescibacteria group bacterium]|jgi:hypothetical protein